MKILIIEDDPIIATDILLLLKSNGFDQVDYVSDGVKALDRFKNNRPEFVILDIHLGSNSNGMDLARLLHADYKIPFLFLTSFSDPLTLQEAQQCHPYGYIVKPFQEQTLLATIQIAWNNYIDKVNSKSHQLLPEWQLLTEKEADICTFLMNGISNKQIAEKLEVSVNTVKFHLKNIYTKFGVNGRTELLSNLLKK